MLRLRHARDSDIGVPARKLTDHMLQGTRLDGPPAALMRRPVSLWILCGRHRAAADPFRAPERRGRCALRVAGPRVGPGTEMRGASDDGRPARVLSIQSHGVPPSVPLRGRPCPRGRSGSSTSLVACARTDYMHMLTGYIGPVSFLEQAVAVAQELRTSCSRDTSFGYLCDPVMGDDGRLVRGFLSMHVRHGLPFPRPHSRTRGGQPLSSVNRRASRVSCARARAKARAVVLV